MPTSPSARPATKRRLTVVQEATKPQKVATEADFSVLDAAAAAFGKYQTTAVQGDWQEAPGSTESLDTDLAATEMRRLGTDDVVEGLSAADNLRLTSTGYRKLSDSLRAPTPHATNEPITTPPPPVGFGKKLEVKTLKPAADRRLEFSALAGPLGITPGVPLKLVERSIGGVGVFLLVEAPGRDDQDAPIAILRSKARLAFSESAQRAITAQWDSEFHDSEITVVGPGTDFVAAILPPGALATILNSNYNRNEDGNV